MLLAGLLLLVFSSLSLSFFAGRRIRWTVNIWFCSFFYFTLKSEMARLKESGVLGREDFKKISHGLCLQWLWMDIGSISEKKFVNIILQNHSSKCLAFTMAKMDECFRDRNRCFKALMLLHQRHLLLPLFSYSDLPRRNPYSDLVSVLILGRFSQCFDSW